jgi:hypothetical protein
MPPMKRYHLAAALAGGAVWLAVAASALLAHPASPGRWAPLALLAAALGAATGATLAASGATRRTVGGAMLAAVALAFATLLALDPLAA